MSNGYTKEDIELARRLNIARGRTPQEWRRVADNTVARSRKLFEMGDDRIESYAHANRTGDGALKMARLSAKYRR